MNPPNKLFKYKAFNADSMELILADYLYFANPAQFNDPLDCKTSIVDDINSEDELKEILAMLYNRSIEKKLQEAAKQLRYNGPKTLEKISTLSQSETDMFIMNLYGNFEVFGEGGVTINQVLTNAIGKMVLAGYNKGVLSLAERNDCPLMWSHYADNHKGICLGYEVPDNVKNIIKPINYTGESREITTSQIRAMLNDESSAKIAIEDAIFLRKASDWKYEKEWRMISSVGIQNAQLNLTEIIFGVRCKDTTIYSIMKSLEKRLLPVKFYQIAEVPNRFTLESQEISFDDEGMQQLPRCLQYAIDRMNQEDYILLNNTGD